MYKVGDKLLCKKNIRINFLISAKFKKGNYYKILEIYNNSFRLNDEDIHSWWFTKRSIDVPNLEEHFYTLEEERKLKLKKLQCIK